jgi:hypothetical protein
MTDVKSSGCQTKTIGDDRIGITHWSDGSKRVTLSCRQALRRGRLVFEVVEAVDVPPGFVDFVSDAFGLVGMASEMSRDVSEALATYYEACGTEKTVEALETASRLITRAAYVEEGTEQTEALMGATVRLLALLHRRRSK